MDWWSSPLFVGTATAGATLSGTILVAYLTGVGKHHCPQHEKNFKEIYEYIAADKEEKKAMCRDMDRVMSRVDTALVDIQQVATKIHRKLYSSEVRQTEKNPKTHEITALIVEDYDMSADVLRRTLYSRGIRAHIVSSYENAIGALASFAYDIVLADYDLGGEKSGADLWRFCEDKYPEMPFIVYSGKDDININASMMFMSKPFKPETVFNMLNECGIIT